MEERGITPWWCDGNSKLTWHTDGRVLWKAPSTPALFQLVLNLVQCQNPASGVKSHLLPHRERRKSME
uniref:Macaca fascicularis brain cDNA clone: QflA-16835, similar to human hypothetical protein FLJ38149 (FLJ38149), mRNA, RefSeq: XM_375563.1 n=1 Tax=Macaca fascicularis TaxID=9541 RepID=I7GI37_MACFA|nr:unnamed protein product [Macaca fascicularis]